MVKLSVDHGCYKKWLRFHGRNLPWQVNHGKNFNLPTTLKVKPCVGK